MPQDVVAEIVVQGALELGGEAVHRRYGWKGCVGLAIGTAAVIAGLVYWVA